MGIREASRQRQLDEIFNTIFRRIKEQADRIDTLAGVDGAKYGKFSTANVSNPPTEAQLTAVFGSPATVGKGFYAFIDDNGAHTNEYLVCSDGTKWVIFSGTIAV